MVSLAAPCPASTSSSLPSSSRATSQFIFLLLLLRNRSCFRTEGTDGPCSPPPLRPYFAEVLADAISRARFQPHEYTEDVAPQSQAEYEQAQHNADAITLDKLHETAFRRGLGNSLFVSPDFAVTQADTTAYAHQAFGSASNMAVLASNVDSATLKGLVAKHFNVSGGSALSASASNYYGGEARVMHHGDNVLSVAFKAGSLADPSSVVLQHLLGGEPSVKWSQGTSGLSANAPGAQAFYYGYSDAGLIGFTVRAGHDASKITSTAQKAAAEFKRIASGDIKEDELKRAIAKAKFAAATSLDHRLGSLEVSGAQVR